MAPIFLLATVKDYVMGVILSISDRRINLNPINLHKDR
jgi:hypothetical protein